MIRLLCEINDTTRYARHSGADALDGRLLAVYRERYETIIIIITSKAANRTPAGARSRDPRPPACLPALAGLPPTCCASPTTCACRSTTLRPNVTSAWPNSGRRSAAAYAA